MGMQCRNGFCALFVLILMGCVSGVDTYVNQLTYPNPDMRAHAAEKLGETGHSEAVGPLIKALRDEKAVVRLAAIDALGQLKDKRATKPLLPFVNDRRVRLSFAAIEALGAIGDSIAVDSLGVLVRAELPTIRLAAIDALGQIGHPRALPVLMGEVWNDSPEVRQVTAMALGQIGHRDALGVLAQMLSDPVDAVRVRALYALNRIDPNWRTSTEAEWALRLIRDDLMMYDIVGNEPALLRYGALKGLNTIDPNWREKSWAPKLVSYYAQFLKKTQANERRVAARVLGELGDSRAVTELLLAIRDPDLRVRNQAVRSLGILGDPASGPALREVLSGPDLAMKSEAAITLSKLGDRDAIPDILALITPDIMKARNARDGAQIPYGVARAIGNFQAREGVAVLGQLLNHHWENVRREAVVAFGKLGDPNSGRRVVSALQDRSTNVRLTAVQTLAKLDVKESVHEIIGQLGVSDDRVIVDALDQLEPHWRDLPPAQVQIDRLVRMYKSGGIEAKRASIRALAEIGGEKAHAVLMDVLERRDLDLVAEAHAYYLDMPTAIPTLLRSLERYGTEKMVRAFLSSKYLKLNEAARIWAHSRGMALVSAPEIQEEEEVF